MTGAKSEGKSEANGREKIKKLDGGDKETAQSTGRGEISTKKEIANEIKGGHYASDEVSDRKQKSYANQAAPEVNRHY